MLGITRKYEIPNTEIRNTTRLIEHCTIYNKTQMAGYLVRSANGTRIILEWRTMLGKRIKTRLPAKLSDDIKRSPKNWMNKAQNGSEEKEKKNN